MTSEFPRREERPGRRLSPEDQEHLEAIAFHTAKLFGGLREGTPWAFLIPHFVKLDQQIAWALNAGIDITTVVQADGQGVDTRVQEMLTDEGFFEDPSTKAPDFPPEEWGKP
jgi:hypothetical protein